MLAAARRPRPAVLLSALLVVLLVTAGAVLARATAGNAAAGGNNGGTATANDAAFSVSANPASLSVLRGGATSTSISVTGTNGFSGTVALSLSAPLPMGVSHAFSPVTLDVRGGQVRTSTLTLTTSSSAELRTSSLPIVAASGSTRQTAPLSLTVTATPPPTASPTPTACGNCKGNSGNGTGNGSAGTTPQGMALTVALDKLAGSLAPGSPATLQVVVTNTNNSAVSLTRATGRVTRIAGPQGNLGKPACDVAWFSIAPWNGATRIAAGSTATVPLVITLEGRPLDQDNCKGVRFDVALDATANQA